jgi:hypothetical protein
MGDRPNDPLAEARRIAGDNGLYIATVQDKRLDDASRIYYVDAYVVYRQGLARGAGTRLGKRSNKSALLSFVKKLVGPVTA